MSVRKGASAMSSALARSTLASMPATPQGGTYMPIEPKYPPDLTSGPTTSVAGKSSTWKGAEIVVDATMATRKCAADGGQCLFPVTFQVRNIGLQPRRTIPSACDSA